MEYIFAVPGEENLDLLESLRTSSIELVLTRHEQGAGFMAATYGRLTGKAGVCLATLGPGATNLTTPAAYAALGAFPLVIITGQKPIKTSKQAQFQIVDVVSLFTPLCKASTQIVNGNRIPSLVRRARRRIAGDPAEAAVREAAEFFRGYFRVNRDRYAEAWVANSMITVAESGILDAEALVDLTMGFAVASAETSTSLINNSVNLLARDGDLHDFLRGGDEAVTSFVEEVLRFASPVQRRPRVVRSACEIGGVALKEGDLVTLLIGSAHRDPEAFSDPDTFLPSRTPNRHLAFGMGARSCPGSQLGRLEARHVLSELAAQTRRVELARPDEPLTYPAQLALRQPMNLHVRAIPS